MPDTTLPRNFYTALMAAVIAGCLCISLPPAKAAAGTDELAAVSTQHEARIGGRKLAYTADAGRLPIRDMESGELRGRMFYVAYRLPANGDRPRPVMFIWGGGPSGPSLGMQMVYGPKSVKDGRLIDNDLSLLAVADLVFVDPVGTGFSRPAKPEYVKEFYSTKGDARSVAEFIRVWVALNDAATSALFLNGQSYGVWRAAIVGELLEQSGRRVAGIVLTSGGMGMADEFTDRPYEIAYRVADYAATALYHGKLPTELGTTAEDAWRQAELWAREAYAPALARIDALDDGERASLAQELSRRTGYPLDAIDKDKLTFTPREYLRDFTGEEGRPLDTFDMRHIRGDDDGTDDAADARAQAHYLREVLGYRTDLAYIGLEQGYSPVTAPDYTGIGSRWNYDSGDGSDLPQAMAGEGPPGKEPWLRRAIDLNPQLQVFVEAAVYDSLNYCAANEDRKRRMPAELADNFELHCYYAGHGSFRDPETYPLIARDIRDFILRVTRQ